MKQPLELYLGPCMLESENLALEVAHKIVSDFKGLGNKVQIYFKGSFDKANRTSIDSYRGPGLEKGLQILEKIKSQYRLPVITDFHLPSQAFEVASVVDVLQVPAFLCRQTDMIVTGAQSCAQYSRILKVKKGQFLSPQETQNIVKKAQNFIDLEKIRLTERGSSFGHNRLVVDMSSFQIMKEFGVKVIHDATHCVQLPGGHGTSSGGNRQYVKNLAKAAVAAGADGVFIETHPNPQKALSDADTSWPLNELYDLVESLLKIYEVA